MSAHRGGSVDAFAELAGRHVHWIHSAARRRVGDDHLAEDVTQTVLVALATRGPTGKEAPVASWLFGVLRHAAARAVRDRDRRRRREAAVAVDPNATTTAAPAWADVAPLLEDAVARLRRRDRDAVLLRFYQQQSFAEVGAALGVSEDGARKRVARAVDRLHRYFTARGVTTLSAALPDLLLAHATQPAPASVVAAASRVPRPPVRTLRWVWPAAAGAGLAAATGAAWCLTSPPPSPAVAAATRPAAVASPAPDNDPTTRPTDVTFDRLLAGVAHTEHQFTHLHVRNFQTTLSTRTGDTGPWVQTPIGSSGSAWYVDDPRGPQRIYLTSQVSRWEQGAEPYVHQMLDLSWDGTTGVTMRLAGQSRGRWIRERQASVTTEMPMELEAYARVNTGVTFTLQYSLQTADLARPRQTRRAVSELFRTAHANAGAQFTLVRQRVNGFDAVRVQLEHPVGRMAWWFAPDRGFALVKQQEVMSLPGQSRTEGIDVYDLRQVGPDLWFPMRASAVRADYRQRGSYDRYDYRADDVTANDPAFDAAVFRPTVPTGWIVTDNTHQPPREYVKMPDGTELEIHTGSTMPRVPAAEDKRPDGPGPAITRDPRAWW